MAFLEMSDCSIVMVTLLDFGFAGSVLSKRNNSSKNKNLKILTYYFFYFYNYVENQKNIRAEIYCNY